MAEANNQERSNTETSSERKQSAPSQSPESGTPDVGERDVEEETLEAEDYLSTLQHVQAEFENYKKRVERDRADYIEQANAQIILKLLPVLDNFERALGSENSNSDAFRKGVYMIFSQLKGILSAEGLSVIEAVGEEFDPYYHECVLAETGDYDDDIVIEEFEKGYMFKKKVLRPSKVKVGKRGD